MRALIKPIAVLVADQVDYCVHEQAGVLSQRSMPLVGWQELASLTRAAPVWILQGTERKQAENADCQKIAGNR